MQIADWLLAEPRPKNAQKKCAKTNIGFLRIVISSINSVQQES